MKSFNPKRIFSANSAMFIAFILILIVGMSLGDNCSSDAECQPLKTFRACRYGVCQCKKVSHYDVRSKMCRIHVGGTCDTTRGSEQCVENAYCFLTGTYATQGRCDCKKGYPETTEGLCNSAARYYSSVFCIFLVPIMLGSLYCNS